MATESDNVNSGALGTLLAVGTIATLGVALVVTALVRAETSEETAKKELGADRPFRDLVAEQTAKLAQPASYVDRSRGVVSLPIDRAMELTVSGLIKDPNSATPPAAAGGTGGTGGAAAGGSAALGGSGGVATEEAKAAPGEEKKPAAGEEKKDVEKKDVEKKKDGPKPKPGVPAAPAPAPAPAPAAPAPAAPAAPAPAPNGQ